MAFFPTEIFADFPISTIKFNDGNSTQWVLNIGGVTQTESSGIQIPIFVIILGILGAYIRYLYLGIREFKTEMGKMLINFDKITRKLERAEEEFNNVESEINNIIKSSPASKIEYFSKYPDQYKKKKDKLQIKYDEYQYKVNFETISHVLATVGFFLLAPLLAIMGWLILSIGGTENNMTFALVSITAGFTAKSIIGRAISLVEGQFKTNTQTTQNPIIFLTPSKGKVKETLTITGQKFKENSVITITLDDDELEIESPIKTDEKGSFKYQLQIPTLEEGIHQISAQDEENNSNEKEFEIISGNVEENN
ncbi:MAG: hypothetical protein KC444_00835 [Nitrosopumilus sp.]|nr:hypothetical protein [Nitrosopumilus sp.]